MICESRTLNSFSELFFFLYCPEVPIKEPEVVQQKEPEQELLAAPPQERQREPSPVPSLDDHHNDTKDSWAKASPEKRRYDSDDTPPQPSQEVEHMDAKLERLKADQKFERRMSQLLVNKSSLLTSQLYN